MWVITADGIINKIQNVQWIDFHIPRTIQFFTCIFFFLATCPCRWRCRRRCVVCDSWYSRSFQNLFAFICFFDGSSLIPAVPISLFSLSLCRLFPELFECVHDSHTRKSHTRYTPLAHFIHLVSALFSSSSPLPPQTIVWLWIMHMKNNDFDYFSSQKKRKKNNMKTGRKVESKA